MDLRLYVYQLGGVGIQYVPGHSRAKIRQVTLVYLSISDVNRFREALMRSSCTLLPGDIRCASCVCASSRLSFGRSWNRFRAFKQEQEEDARRKELSTRAGRDLYRSPLRTGRVATEREVSQAP